MGYWNNLYRFRIERLCSVNGNYLDDVTCDIVKVVTLWQKSLCLALTPARQRQGTQAQHNAARNREPADPHSVHGQST